MQVRCRGHQVVINWLKRQIKEQHQTVDYTMDHTTNYTNWNQSEDVRWFSHAKILLPRSLRSTIERNNIGLRIEMTANGLAWILQRPWMKYNHLQVNMPKDPAKSHYDLWLISDSKYMVAWTSFLQIFLENALQFLKGISIPVHDLQYSTSTLSYTHVKI